MQSSTSAVRFLYTVTALASIGEGHIVGDSLDARSKPVANPVVPVRYKYLITREAQLLSHRWMYAEPEWKPGDRDGQESGSVPERAEFARLSQELRD